MKVENTKCYSRKNTGEVQKYCRWYSFMESFLSNEPIIEIWEVEGYSLFQVLQHSLVEK